MRLFPWLVLSFLALPYGAFAAEAKPENWPHWRGPLANGFAPHANPPVHWDARTNVRWQAPLPGKGSSTPIVWGERVFVLSALDTGRMAAPKDLPKQDPKFEKKTTPPETYFQFLVLAYDRQTGKELWRKIVAERVPHEGHHFTHNYAAGSPTTDGKFLYASFGSHGVYCLDLEGKLHWQRDLGRMETRLGWGEASTPVLHGDNLVVNWDHEGASFLTVLDARTGKTRWKVDRDEPTSWSTPLVTDYKGQTQIVIPGTRKVRSYDLASGKVIWEAPGLTVNCIPSTVRFEDMAICMSGYRGSKIRAISLDARGEVDREHLRWQYDTGTPYVPSPALAGHRLYFTQSNDPFLSCLDARTGKVILNRQRLAGVRSFYASPVVAADRLYLVDRDGTTLVVKVGDSFEVLAVNRLPEPIDASPAVVGKQLFLRGEKNLYCIEER